jgi:hypothetical protein
MKKYTAEPILLFSLLMFICQCAGAQDYLLTSRGDSLTGEVRPLLYGPEKKVQIVSGDKQKTTYSIFQVRAFSSEGEIYHPVKGETGYVFMKLVQPGYLSLYAYQLENQTRFDGLFLKKIDGQTLAVPNLGFKKYMARFLEDCPEVAERIQSGALGKKELKEVVGEYNACIANRTIDHSHVVAQREEQKQKINTWESLEEKIRQKDFSEKNNALEMIAEIRKKIERRESIPNFLVEGLKNSLKDTGLSQDFEDALQQAN